MKAFILAALIGVSVATNGAVSAHAADFATKFFAEQSLNGG